MVTEQQVLELTVQHVVAVVATVHIHRPHSLRMVEVVAAQVAAQVVVQVQAVLGLVGQVQVPLWFIPRPKLELLLQYEKM
ncbi:hypothetical protein [Vibrio diabolicus]|uniref:hypothetical protein n=1 Tax=Vibrio diabolicus TaxID=50719 RepID=UPI002119D0E3|nr:hypothetical protein [Vibrio diabolicus]